MEAQVIVFVGVLTALIVVGIAVAARIDTLNHRKLLAEADKEHGHTAHQSESSDSILLASRELPQTVRATDSSCLTSARCLCVSVFISPGTPILTP